MRLGVGDIAKACAGRIAGGGRAQATSLAWDSRCVEPGALYAALPGERVDGYDFCGAALDAGAAAVLVQREPDPGLLAKARECSAAVIQVADCMQAVTDLAAAWRRQLGATVIGVTGSNGKTTTKNLVAHVLGSARRTVATLANQNNELGVPATVLRADEDTQALVVELGMRGAGQIAQLCSTVRPQWGLVTSVGTSHIELLGSREAIAAAKAELFEALPEGGVAFVNACDDALLAAVDLPALEARGVRIVFFAGAGLAVREGGTCGFLGEKPAVWAENVALDAAGRPTFQLRARGFGQDGAGACACTVRLPLAGVHNVSNACAAAAVGLAAGMAPGDVARALECAPATEGRGLVTTAPGGFTVVDDCYNANPDSMAASLRTFGALSAPGRKVAVLGDMGELGAFSEEGHAQVGALAGAVGLDALVCVGPRSRQIAAAALAAGMPNESVTCVDDAAQALQAAGAMLAPGDAVLVKASHSVGLDAVVKGLMQRA